jgi:dodecin
MNAHRTLSDDAQDERSDGMPVIKSIDIVGVSDESWEAAAREALAEASKTIRHIIAMEVLHNTAVVEDGRIKEYQAHTRISFRLER